MRVLTGTSMLDWHPFLIACYLRGPLVCSLFHSTDTGHGSALATVPAGLTTAAGVGSNSGRPGTRTD